MAGRVLSFFDRLRATEASPADADDRPDTPLIHRFQAGDTSVFAELYERHYTRVYRTALRTLGDPAEAEDIAQEVFVRTWHALPAFEIRARLSTWLYRVTVNACLDHLKSGRRKYERPAAEGTIDHHRADAPSPGAQYIAEERRLLVTRAITRLPEKYRLVVILRDIEERPYVEIAEILDLPVTTLKMRAIRGREMLAKLIERMTQP